MVPVSPRMDAGLDSTMRASLDSLNHIFLSSVSGDTASLADFDQKWAAFAQKLTSCSDELHPETLNMAYTFASTVSAVANGMLDIQTASTGVCHQFESDVDDLLTSELESSTSKKEHLHNLPAYIEPSARWLASNIHNPYPSSEVRTRISLQTRSPRKDIDAWFVDARKRIGWNNLRKKRFDNKRANIITAATQFFVKQESLNCMTLESELVGLEAAAKTLLSQFEQTLLAQKLDVAVMDMTPDLHLRAKEGRRKRDEATRSYPTPEHSPTSASMASLPSPSSSPCPVSRELPHRKRRRSGSYSEDEEYVARESQRRRFPRSPTLALSEISEYDIGLPSPATTCAEVDGQEQYSEVQVESKDILRLSKRKRCLSEGDDERRAKRPQTALHAPLAHSVSNPTPPTFPPFGDWFSHFDPTSPTFLLEMPPPVSDQPPASTETLQVECFDFASLSGVPDHGSAFLPAHASTGFSAHPTSNQSILLSPTSAHLLEENINWLGLNGLSSDPLSTNDPSLGDFGIPSAPSGLENAFVDSLPALDTNFQSLFGLPGMDWLSTPSFTNPGSFDVHAPPPSDDPFFHGIRPESLAFSDKEEKRRQLKELEAKLNAIRAEIEAEP